MLREALETDFDAIVQSKHLDPTGSKAKRSSITVHLLPSPMPSQVEDRREGILIVKPPTTSLRPALFTVCPGRSPVGTFAEKGLACPPRSGWGKQSHRLKKQTGHTPPWTFRSVYTWVFCTSSVNAVEIWNSTPRLP
jgi:hypothetical protein